LALCKLGTKIMQKKENQKPVWQTFCQIFKQTVLNG